MSILLIQKTFIKPSATFIEETLWFCTWFGLITIHTLADFVNVHLNINNIKIVTNMIVVIISPFG